MNSRIKYNIQGIFMLNQKTIPPTLNKHLTDDMFNKPNKEGMEHVLYHLLQFTNPNCFETFNWPIITIKEATEFRNTATLIINSLEGFVYEKSSNVVRKVNSSLLANPGGPVFTFLIYQLCLFIKCDILKKKSISFLNAPSYVEDEYIEKKIAVFDKISRSNFIEVNEIISRVDNANKNITESAVKYTEIIQNCKQQIKSLKSELSNIERCKVTDSEVAKLKQAYLHLYDDFEQKKLIAMKCARLADLILKIPESFDANMIYFTLNIDKDKLMECDGKLNFVKLLTFIKNTIVSSINRCEQINDEQEMYDHILVLQQSVINMSEQMQCYERIMKFQNNLISDLKIENKQLEEKIFTKKRFENIDARLQSVYNSIPPIILKADSTGKPKFMNSENYKNPRLASSSQNNDLPYNYQRIFFDEIKCVYRATLPNQNEVDVNNDMYENSNGQSPTLNESNRAIKGTLNQSNENEKLLNETDVLNIGSETNIEEDKVKHISISRKSIDNLKEKFIKIKNQGLSMISYSP